MHFPAPATNGNCLFSATHVFHESIKENSTQTISISRKYFLG